MFFKIIILKNLPIFLRKHICWSLLLTKLQAWRRTTLLKRDSSAGIFMRILQNFSEQLFYRTSPVAASAAFRWSPWCCINVLRTFNYDCTLTRYGFRVYEKFSIVLIHYISLKLIPLHHLSASRNITSEVFWGKIIPRIQSISWKIRYLM